MTKMNVQSFVFFDSLIEFLENLGNKIEVLSKYFLLIVGYVLIIDMFLGILTRLLGSPLSFTEEIARFCMLWFCFIGGSIAVKNNSLVGFTLIAEKLPTSVQRYLNVIDTACVMVFLCIFLYVGVPALKLFSFGTASISKINLFWTAVTIWVGAAIMLYYLIVRLLIDIRVILINRKKQNNSEVK